MKNSIQNILSKGGNGLPFVFDNFNGWNSLSINGTSDITARTEIDINAEFHADGGSEVHIYCAPTFTDCNDYDTTSTFQMQNRIDGANGKKEIDLTFLKPGIENTISVIPNPSSGHFVVLLNAFDNNSAIKWISIYDLTGRMAYSSGENAISAEIDLTSYPKGLYFIKAIDSVNKSYNQKIILQ